MTKTQNIELCNYLIAQMGQNKPFVLSLNADQTKALYKIASTSNHIDSRHIKVLTLATWQLSSQNKGCSIEVNDENFDAIYQMLTPYKALLEYRRANSIFDVGDLVIKTHPKNIILWPVLGVYKNGGVWLDYKGFCWKSPRVRHATDEEIKAGCRL